MSDTNNSGDKTPTRPPSKPLSLKRPVEQGMVRQSFSHGRSKQVEVVTMKRRTIGAAPGTVAPREPAPAPPQARPSAAAPAAAPPRPGTTPTRAPSGVVLRTLSDHERDARASALADAQRRAEVAAARARLEVGEAIEQHIGLLRELAALHGFDPDRAWVLQNDGTLVEAPSR